MNLIEVGEVLLKVTASLAAGAIVFIGVSKAVESNKRARNCQQGQENSSAQQQRPNYQQQSSCPQQQNNNNNNGGYEESSIMSGIRATQSTCEKLGTMAGAVVTVFEAAGKLFGKDSGQAPQQYQNSTWYNGNNYQRGCGTTGNQQPGTVNLTRISPFITVAGPSNNSGNCYPV